MAVYASYRLYQCESGKDCRPAYHGHQPCRHFLKKAFEWKANEDLSLVEISNRLQARGLKIEDKRLSHYFRNPFYCGFIVSKLIPGELIEGKHPPLVSKNTFLKVQQNMEKYGGGNIILQEVDELPLKQFVKCDSCGTSFTGYLVKKKNLYYYKCNLKGCSNNRSQKWMHQHFEELLLKFSIEKSLMPIIKKMLMYLLREKTKVSAEDHKSIKQELTKQKNQFDKLEERFATGDIDQTLFNKYRVKYQDKMRQLESEFDPNQNQLSNLEMAVEKCLQMASELPSLWRNSNFNTKRRIQNLLFPQGILYHRKKDNYRTLKINSLFSAIPYLARLSSENKKRDFDFLTEIPAWVGPPGLEPGTT